LLVLAHFQPIIPFAFFTYWQIETLGILGYS